MKKIDYKWIALSCTSLGAFLSIMNGSTLIIALPLIIRDLHMGLGVAVWCIMGYMLAITILVPSIGRVADMYGRKTLFVSGFAIFTLASLLCGVSANGWQLLIYRLIQSIGGSLLVANSTAIVADAFERNELGQAMGINAMIISIASVIGPVLGGYLAGLGWRYIFYINVPLGIIGTYWAWLQLKELDIIPEHQIFDWAGTVVFSVGMFILLLVLSFGGFIGWLNPYVLLSLVISMILMLLFVLIELRSKQPMLDMRLFEIRILGFAFGSNLLNGIARGAVTFLLIFYFQGVKGFDPLMSGVLLTPFAISMMIVSPISGWLSDKHGSRELSSLGLLVSAVGLLGLMFLNAGSPLYVPIIWMSIMGAGSGFFMSPNNRSIMGSVPSDRRGIAAATRTMMNNGGMVISIALAMVAISSSISMSTLLKLFVGAQVGSEGIAIEHFISGLRMAFTISFVFSLVAAFISYLRGPEPKWEEGGLAENPKG